MHRRAGSALCPLPLLRGRSRGGRGGRPASHVLPGGSWAGKGGSLACEFGGLCSRVDLACFHGKTFWRVCLAGLFGGSSWLIYSAGFSKQEKTCCWTMKRNRKERNVLWWICRLWYHYVASNIVLFTFVAGSPEPANCGLTTVVMWICESHCE